VREIQAITVVYVMCFVLGVIWIFVRAEDAAKREDGLFLGARFESRAPGEAQPLGCGRERGDVDQLWAVWCEMLRCSSCGVSNGFVRVPVPSAGPTRSGGRRQPSRDAARRRTAP
jgi:hypothetical protein